MSSPWSDRDYGRERGGLVFGLLLIVVGVMFLAGEQLNVDWSAYGWPLYIIVPGAVLFVLGLLVPNEAGLGMTIPGGIITTVGLVLAFQESTDTYASWAYVWALVAPGSVGVSLFTYGLLHRRLDLVDAGLRTAAVGLGLFVGFGLFFENVIGLDDTAKTNVLRDGMPFMAVVLGAIIVLINILPHPRFEKHEPSMSDTWHPDNLPPAPPTSPTPPTPPESGS
jgi:hypothetical protein